MKTVIGETYKYNGQTYKAKATNSPSSWDCGACDFREGNNGCTVRLFMEPGMPDTCVTEEGHGVQFKIMED